MAAYPLTRRSEGPVPLRGKVIRIVRAAGRTAKDEASSVVGSKLKGRVPSRPEVEVATKLMVSRERRGRRKVDVQPAPRMRRSTGGGVLVIVNGTRVAIEAYDVVKTYPQPRVILCTVIKCYE